MPWTSEHTKWLVETDERLTTADGKDVEVWEFRHENDEAVLSAWAKHFRNHYCLDTEIDVLRGNSSHYDYLTNFKFPSTTSTLGPVIRAGDFREIQVADFLALGWILRLRFASRRMTEEAACHPARSRRVYVFRLCGRMDSATPLRVAQNDKVGVSPCAQSQGLCIFVCAIGVDSATPLRVAQNDRGGVVPLREVAGSMYFGCAVGWILRLRFASRRMTEGACHRQKGWILRLRYASRRMTGWAMSPCAKSQGPGIAVCARSGFCDSATRRAE